MGQAIRSKKLSKAAFEAEFRSEFKRRLIMTVEDAGMDQDELDRHYEWYQNGETIKEQITDYADKYDLDDKDRTAWM